MQQFTSHVAVPALHNVGSVILHYTPYSPDLEPSDYYLFTKLKEIASRLKFTSHEEVKDAALALRVAGEYIEGEK